MENLLAFLSFSDANVRWVTAGTMIIGICSGMTGVFTFLRKRSLVGDTVSHSVLPGIAGAFILSGTKNPIYLLIGALITGFTSVYLSELIVRKSKLKPDTAHALLLSVFFGIGIVMMSSIQNSGNAAQSGLNNFLFGKAAAVGRFDLEVFGMAALGVMACILFFYKELKFVSFSPDFAEVAGTKIRFFEFLLSFITVVTVTVGIQSVGVVLTAALLITPAAAARYWTDKLWIMLLLAAFFGALGGFTGSFISYSAPDMPTGPWIVSAVTGLALLSIFFAPKKGILQNMILRRKHIAKMRSENILKIIWNIEERNENQSAPVSVSQIRIAGFESEKEVLREMNILKRKGLLEKKENGFAFTESGRETGKRITRLHRLWELYLTEYVKMKPDHVHENAEAIEHILTPEIEKELEELLNFPQKDPHNRSIPYNKKP